MMWPPAPGYLGAHPRSEIFRRLGQWPSLLQDENRASADLVVEIQGVLNRQPDAFLGACRRLPDHAVELEYRVVHGTSANRERHIHQHVTTAAVIRSAAELMEAEELVRRPATANWAGRRVVSKSAAARNRIGVDAQHTGTRDVYGVAVVGHRDVRALVGAVGAEPTCAEQILERSGSAVCRRSAHAGEREQ